MWYIGLDVGGTHVDLVAINTEGTRSESHHVLPLHKLPEEVAPIFVTELMHDVKIDRNSIGTVAIGWKHGRNRARTLAMIRSFAHQKLKAAVYWDAETAFVGALPDLSGVVVACGTGAVVYGRLHKKVLYSGGWSPLLGDPGSAFSIGRKALVAALRAADESGPKTKLELMVPRVLHMTLDEMVIVSDGEMEQAVPLLASLCPAVFELADAGDLEAVRIREQAAEAISERIASVLALWPDSESVPLSYAGRLMYARPEYRQMIQNNLRHMGMPVTWHEPQFRAPYGAVLSVYPSLYQKLTTVESAFDWHRRET